MRSLGPRTDPSTQRRPHGCEETSSIPGSKAASPRAMYLATVVWPTLMPSLSSSPWIRGAPQSGFAMLMSRINSLTSTGTFGRPPCGRDLHRQYKRKPARCQRITVSGLTIARALSTSGAKPYSPTNTKRSIVPRIGRFGELRRRILSWWRSARISISSEARDRNNPISPHQISLQSSIIEPELHPIRCCSPVVLGLR
jgi:hypothetical protein